MRNSMRTSSNTIFSSCSTFAWHFRYRPLYYVSNLKEIKLNDPKSQTAVCRLTDQKFPIEDSIFAVFVVLKLVKELLEAAADKVKIFSKRCAILPLILNFRSHHSRHTLKTHYQNLEYLYLFLEH